MTSRIEFFHKKIKKKVKKEPEWIWIRNFFCVSHSKAQNVDFNFKINHLERKKYEYYCFTSAAAFLGFPRQTTPSHPLGRPQVAQSVKVEKNWRVEITINDFC